MSELRPKGFETRKTEDSGLSHRSNMSGTEQGRQLEAMMKKPQDPPKGYELEKYTNNPEQEKKDYQELTQECNIQTIEMEKVRYKLGNNIWFYDETRQFRKLDYCLQLKEHFDIIENYFNRGLKDKQHLAKVYDAWIQIKISQNQQKYLDIIDIRKETDLLQEEREIRNKKLEVINSLSTKDLSLIEEKRNYKYKDRNIADACKNIRMFIESSKKDKAKILEACQNLDKLKDALDNKEQIIGSSHMDTFMNVEEKLEMKIKAAYE